MKSLYSVFGEIGRDGCVLTGSGDFMVLTSGTSQNEYVIVYLKPFSVAPEVVFTLPSNEDVTECCLSVLGSNAYQCKVKLVNAALFEQQGFCFAARGIRG